jgi:filamentous hemagglutinin family protein
MLIPRVSRHLMQVKIFPKFYPYLAKIPEFGNVVKAKAKKIAIHQSRRSWYLEIALALGISGAMTTTVPSVLAQINPDNTLGGERSLVNNTGTSAIIRGGAQRGINLFHSFSNFNVNPGQTVLFLDPGVLNIFGRVTGINPSNIQGTLGVIGGNANLFLLNPNGILFGPNSQLDLKGSFVATTADAIQFGNNGSFSALTPNVPPATLSINPSAFLFNQIAAKPISNQSTTGLQVSEGKSLLLLGGNVTVDGGVLRAPGGRIELGGLAASGTVNIEDVNSLKLAFPDGVTRADVTLNNNAIVDVVAGNGGDIAINARNISILGGTNVCAGIGSSDFCKTPSNSLGSTDSKAGNIILAGTGDVKISQSRLENRLNEGATGNSGDIFEALIKRNTAFGSIGISGASVSMTDNAQISTTSFGTGSAGIVYIETKGKFSVDNSGVFSSMSAPQQKGNAGGILVDAGSIALNNSVMRVQNSGIGDAGIVYLKADGGNISFNNSQIFSDILSGGVGNARGVLLEADSISLSNGSRLTSNTYGQGNAGDVILTAKEGTIALDGTQTAIFSTVESGAVGNGGSIQIETGTLTLSDGAQLQTLVRGPSADGTLPGGKGNAGVVYILATDSVNLIGRGDVPVAQTAIFSTINEGADGSTGNNSFAGDAFNNLLGQGGNAVGSIFILTGNLSLSNGAVLNSSTYGNGNAGAVVVLALDKISLTNGSTIGSFVGTNAQGDAGGVLIGADSVSMTNDSRVTTSTYGQGNAGLVFILASDKISLTDSSIIDSVVGTNAQGAAGGVLLNAGSVSIKNASSLTTSTFGQGNAGLVLVLASGDVSVVGKDSKILSTAEAGSNFAAGGIGVVASTLYIKDGGTVSVNNQGLGEAGAIAINVRDLRLENQGNLSATTLSGQGGDINLEVQDLLVLTRGSNISTTAGLAPAGGDGGNVTINGRPYIIAAPVKDNNSNITAQAYTGKGGNIFIDASKLYEIERRTEVPPTNDISASSQYGIAGQETINILNPFALNEVNNLPQSPVDISRLIAQNCTPRNGKTAAEENKFIYTGRGGIPANPYNVLQNESAIADWVTLDKQKLRLQSLESSKVKPSKEVPTYIEAQGWKYGPNGEVILTAGSPTVTPQSPTFIPPACRGS